MQNEQRRIESLNDVRTYLSRLRYALNNGASITFQIDRRVDDDRDVRYTNKYTVATLFPDEAPVIALKRELLTITEKEYICTVRDLKFKNKSEMRVFGKKYNCSDEVYIKIRVELLDPQNNGQTTTFVMSFHFAEEPFTDEDFPYR